MSDTTDTAINSNPAGPGPQPLPGSLNPAQADATPVSQLHFWKLKINADARV